MNANATPAAIVPRALKVKGAALYCSVSEISIRRAIKRGLLKPSRVFRHPLIPVEQLDALLERGQA